MKAISKRVGTVAVLIAFGASIGWNPGPTGAAAEPIPVGGHARTASDEAGLYEALLLAASPAAGWTPAQAGAEEFSEAEGRALSDLAQAKGALGAYFDRETSTYVVVVPSSDPGVFTRADAGEVAVDVRIEHQSIDHATIAAIASKLESKRATGEAPYDYGFGFDLRTGLVEILHDGPDGAFEGIAAEFPGSTTLRRGKFFLAGMHDDTAPFAGGADLNGDKGCTSGFTMKWSNGTKRMITAGHCFHDVNSTQTNMGQGSIDGAGGWPDYDIGQVSGSTYEGYVWTGTNSKRKVSDGANPVVGGYYCTSGRSSGVTCSWQVTQLNVTICWSGLPACSKSLAAFKRSDNAHVVPGDSGGPLWAGTVGLDGELRAGVRGVISGYFWDVFTSSWRSYATQYNRIVTEFGGTALVPA